MIKIKSINLSLTFYIIMLLSSTSCFLDELENQYGVSNATQFDYYICESKVCPDTKSTSVGKTIILDIPDLDPKATDIKWRVTGAPGGATWYPSTKNAKIESFTPNSSGSYYINVSYSLKGVRCSCDFIIDVELSGCNTNICPDSTTIFIGDSTKLDIQGVDPGATQIYWRIISSPGEATWNPPAQNAITETFTPAKLGTYNLQVSYVIDGYTCSCDFIVYVAPPCDDNICPGSTTMIAGDTTTLDIQGVNPLATEINWQVLSSPGGATWNPPAKNAITELFTPTSSGIFHIQVSYILYGLPCTCDFYVTVEPKPCDKSICPPSTTMTAGKTTTLDINGVDPAATQINWKVLSSPGGATWNPSTKNAITESFTPNTNGSYHIQVSYILYGQTCTCDFYVTVKPNSCDDTEGILTTNDSYGPGAVRTAHKPINCGAGSTVKLDNGPPKNRINIIFIGDGYTQAEQNTTWSRDVNNALAIMFGGNTEPYGTYKKYLNICQLNVASNESGIDIATGNWPPSNYTYIEYKDTAFDGVCNENSLGTMNNSKVYQKIDQIFSGTGMEADWIGGVLNSNRWCAAGTSIANWAGSVSHLDMAFHEAGHSWHGLADEYIYAGLTYTGEEKTKVNLTKYYGAKWSEWAGYNQPGIGQISWYEGGGLNEFGLYRPSPNGKMNWLENPHNSVGIQKIIHDIYSLVRPIDAWTDNSQTLNYPCRIEIKVIDPGLVNVRWFINGKQVYAPNKEMLILKDYSLSAGVHSIKVVVSDPTSYVRNNRDDLSQTITWSVNF